MQFRSNVSSSHFYNASLGVEVIVHRVKNITSLWFGAYRFCFISNYRGYLPFKKFYWLSCSVAPAISVFFMHTLFSMYIHLMLENAHFLFYTQWAQKKQKQFLWKRVLVANEPSVYSGTTVPNEPLLLLPGQKKQKQFLQKRVLVANELGVSSGTTVRNELLLLLPGYNILSDLHSQALTKTTLCFFFQFIK